LGGPVRNAELGANFIKADSAATRGRYLGEPEKILSLGERHLISMPEIDTIICYL
jgi:hypothetical protein